MCEIRAIRGFKKIPTRPRYLWPKSGQYISERPERTSQNEGSKRPQQKKKLNHE
jgi:hypothetical protein